MFCSVIRTLRGTNLRVPNPIYAVQARGWHADGEGAGDELPLTPVGKDSEGGNHSNRVCHGEVGLYVDQRDDMVMKPRRPYFSSADKAVEDFLRGPHVCH